MSRVDIDRRGPTYTKDTLRDLHALNPDADLYFITGADALASILSWQNWEEMFSIARFVGVSRPGYDLDGKHIAAAMEELPADALHPGRGARAGDLVDRLPQARRGGPADLVPGARRRRAVRVQAQPLSQPHPQWRPQGSSRYDRLRRSRSQMATVAARAAASKLADDVVVIDVSGQLVITDCFVIASASNERQVNAIVDEVEEKMRVAGYKPARREGAREGRWTLLDFVDIVVHIQHQDERNFYALDRLVARLPGRAGRAGAREPGMRIRRLVMLRHGQTEYNAGSRMQGQLDTELSDLGREQAVAAAEVLAKRQPLVIVSSDLRRALDTAVALGERSGQPVLVDTRLRETHLGDWQGHDPSRGGRGGAGCAGWRGGTTPGGRRTAGRAGSTSPRAACRWWPSWSPNKAEWGVDEPERPVVLVAHGGLIAALTGGAAGAAGRQLADPRRHG